MTSGLIPDMSSTAVNLRALRARPFVQDEEDSGLAPGALPADAQAPAQAQPVQNAPIGDSRPADQPEMQSSGLAPDSSNPVVKQTPQDLSGLEPMQAGPLDNMKAAAAQRQNVIMPTDANAVPGAHHGWRKAGDIAAAIGLAGLTMNPMAGLGLYRNLHNAPLRKAQATAEAEQERLDKNFDQNKAIETAGTNEEKIQGLTEQREAKGKELEAVQQKLQNTFIAGSERQDPTSPTGWVATTAGGQDKPFTPKQDHVQTKAQIEQQEFDVRRKRAQELHLDPEDTKYYELNGKLKEPSPQTNIHVPSAESEQWNAYVQSLGHPPTQDDILRYKRGEKSPGNTRQAMTQATQQQTAELLAEENRFKKEWNAAYNGGNSDPGTLEQLKAEHEAKKGLIMGGYNAKVQELGGTQAQPSAPVQRPQPAAQPQQPAPAQHPAGQQFKAANGKTFSQGQTVYKGNQAYSVQGVDQQGNLILRAGK